MLTQNFITRGFSLYGMMILRSVKSVSRYHPLLDSAAVAKMRLSRIIRLATEDLVAASRTWRKKVLLTA